MPKLSAYDFGHHSAEYDEDRLRDQSCFCRTKSWEEATKPHKFLIVGRKGSGKTAIRIGMDAYQKQINQVSCHMGFAKFSSDTLLQLLTPVKHPLFDRAIFFKNVWRFAIAARIAHAVLRSSLSKSTKDRLGRFASIFDSPGDLPHCRDEESEFSLQNVFSSATLKVIELIASNPLPNQILDYPINRRFRDAESELHTLFSQQIAEVLLTLDDFDEAFEEYHEVAQPMIIGVTDAIKEIWADHESSRPSLRIKAFVPQDAFGPRDYRHYDKVDPVSIHWSSLDLSLFVARRIYGALRQSGVGGIPRRSPTTAVEAASTLHHLFGSISESATYRDAITWLAHFSLERPRDLIILLDKIRSDILMSDPGARVISEQDLYKYLPEASKAIATNIVREYSSKFPRLSTAISAFTEGTAELSPTEVIAKLSTVRGLVSAEQSESYWQNALYECGFLCRVFLRKSGSQWRKVAVTSWRDDAPEDVDAKTYVIHQVFWRFSRVAGPEWPFQYA